MSEYEIIDIREDNARDKLSSVLYCPKLRFYKETEDGEQIVTSYSANVENSFILVDTRTKYKKIFYNESNGEFLFKTEEDAKKYFNEYKDDKKAFVLAGYMGGIDDGYFLAFKNGDKLSDFLDQVQLLLNERRLSIWQYRNSNIFTCNEVIGTIFIHEVSLIEEQVKREYHLMQVDDPGIKHKLENICKGYKITLVSPNEDFEFEETNKLFSRTGHDKPIYIVLTKDDNSDIPIFLPNKLGFSSFSSLAEAEKAIEEDKKGSNLYVAISNDELRMMGHAVSNSSKGLINYLATVWNDLKYVKELKITEFGDLFIDKKDIDLNSQYFPKSDIISIQRIEYK